MDRQIRRTGLVLTVLFVLLFVQLVNLQVFSAERLYEDPANAYRQIIAQYHVDRGRILAADGKTELAFSKQTGDNLEYLRRYPQGELYANITGFYSLVYGMSNLERTYDSQLGARSDESLPTNIWDELQDKPKQGSSIVTTIDPELQRVAARALAGRPGAVVALDPRTGDVLAMVTEPSYDPNSLSSHDPKAIRTAWTQLNRSPDKPMVSKANQELYPPGSTFKLVTASAALENGYAPSSSWPNPATLALPQTTHTLSNFGGEHCLGGAPQITLAQAFTVSCNVVFGQIGLKLGAKALVDQAEAYGFNEDVPFDVPFVTGNIPEASYFSERLPAVAFSAIGQDQVSANPLQMALIGAAIANGGAEMQPRVVTEIIDPEGEASNAPGPAEWGRPISEQTAAQMTAMMVDVVAHGTGTAAQIPGVTVAGKTGTAQHGTGQAPHAWFVGFAPAQAPKVVVAVVVLDGGSMGSDATGGAVAAPVARSVIEAAIGRGN